jgi:hypothetical protein
MKPFTKEDLERIVEDSAKSGVPAETARYGISYPDALRELWALRSKPLTSAQLFSMDMALRLIHLEARTDADGLQRKLSNAVISAPSEIRREVMQDYCLRCWKFEGACKCPKGFKRLE